MVINRDPEPLAFAGRHQFDLLVYYDQSSISPTNNGPLRNLHLAIYDMEFQKKLKRAPMMLIGGFDAWESSIGEKGIHKYDQGGIYHSSPSFPRPEPHWLQDVVRNGSDQSINMVPVQVHHTVYDYVSSTSINLMLLY